MNLFIFTGNKCFQPHMKKMRKFDRWEIGCHCICYGHGRKRDNLLVSHLATLAWIQYADKKGLCYKESIAAHVQNNRKYLFNCLLFEALGVLQCLDFCMCISQVPIFICKKKIRQLFVVGSRIKKNWRYH